MPDVVHGWCDACEDEPAVERAGGSQLCPDCLEDIPRELIER
jgi:hypothetical protein